jgi:N-acetylglucosamine kinase-like BadF-type ATPase
VPWQVWAAIALAIAVFIGVKIHNHKVSAFGTERFNSGFTAGYAKAKADVEKAVAEVETKGRAMAQDERSKNDAKTVDLDRAAGAVFVRGRGSCCLQSRHSRRRRRLARIRRSRRP